MASSRVSTSAIIVFSSRPFEGGGLVNRNRAGSILVFLARVLDRSAQSREMIWPRPRLTHGRVRDRSGRARTHCIREASPVFLVVG